MNNCHYCDKKAPRNELQNYGDGNGDSWAHKSCWEKAMKRFNESLERSSQTVASWPEWKRMLFKRSNDNDSI